MIRDLLKKSMIWWLFFFMQNFNWISGMSLYSTFSQVVKTVRQRVTHIVFLKFNKVKKTTNELRFKKIFISLEIKFIFKSYKQVQKLFIHAWYKNGPGSWDLKRQTLNSGWMVYMFNNLLKQGPWVYAFGFRLNIFFLR